MRNTYFAFLRLPESSDSKGIRIGDFARDFGLVRDRAAPTPRRRSRSCRRWCCRTRPTGAPALITFKEDADGVGRRYLLRETLARVADSLAAGARRRRPRLPGAGPGRPGARLARCRQRLPARLLLRPLRGVRPLGEDPAGRRVHRQDRGGRHRRDRAAGPARDADATACIPGAEILGTAIENLKNGRQMRYAPAWWAGGARRRAPAAALSRLSARRGLRATGARAAPWSPRCSSPAQWALVGRLILWPLLTPLAAAWTFYAAAGAGRIPARAPRAPGGDGAVLPLHQSARREAAGRARRHRNRRAAR